MAAEPAFDTRTYRRVLSACMVGTLVEYYDFFAYGTAAALVFGPLFFPSQSPTVELLAAYATFGVAFIARPLGGAVFGYFGDRVGRKSTLVAAMLTMGICTIGIGLLPTYATIGWCAPALLCLLRFGQGIGLGGEWGGAALLAIEYAPPGWRGRFGSVPQLGSPIGILSANGVFLVVSLVLSPDQFITWGWRIPFLLSALLVGLGMWMRLRVTETPAFQAALAEGPPPAAPLAEVLRDHRPALIGGCMSLLASSAIFYIVIVFALSYGVAELHYDRQTLLGVEMFAITFMAIGILLAGWLSDRTSARVVMIAGYACQMLMGLAMPWMMTAGAMWTFAAFMSLCLLLMGFVSGPLAMLLSGLFPTRVRYTGISVAFNVGNILGGGLAPLAATSLSAQGGLVPVALYFSGVALCSLLAVLLMPRPSAD